MTELGLFEARLAKAVRALADGANTRVDAMAVANDTIGRRARPGFSFLGRRLAFSVPALVLLGLLLALFAWSLQAGAPSDHRAVVAPPPSPLASTDGAVHEHVTGSGTFSIVAQGTSVQVDGVTQVRGFVATSNDFMDDPRVTGTGTLHLSVDTEGAVGTEWGAYRLENAEGAWEGTVTGGAWSSGNASVVVGWLTGSGAYAGLTYYIDVRTSGFARELEGIIFPGPPPGP